MNKKNNIKSMIELIISNIDEFGSKFVTYKADSMKSLLKDTLEYINNKEQECEELKEENYQSQKNCQICECFIDGIPCKPLRDMDYDLQNVINQLDKCEQTLNEIKKNIKDYCKNMCMTEDKETCENCQILKLLNIINEVKEKLQ